METASRAMGGASNAPRNAQQQMRSSVFDVDPTCGSGRVGGDDDDVCHKPHRTAYAPPPTRGPPEKLPVAGSPSSPKRPPLARLPTGQFADNAPHDVASIVASMRRTLKARGAEGMTGLSRNFRICDTDGSRRLERDELVKCLRLAKLNLDPTELTAVAKYFDAECAAARRRPPPPAAAATTAAASTVAIAIAVPASAVSMSSPPQCRCTPCRPALLVLRGLHAACPPFCLRAARSPAHDLPSRAVHSGSPPPPPLAVPT